ncbi:hypothetical protein FKM82_028831 [Ascaphus truei]
MAGRQTPYFNDHITLYCDRQIRFSCFNSLSLLLRLGKKVHLWFCKFQCSVSFLPGCVPLTLSLLHEILFFFFKVAQTVCRQKALKKIHSQTPGSLTSRTPSRPTSDTICRRTLTEVCKGVWL